MVVIWPLIMFSVMPLSAALIFACFVYFRLVQLFPIEMVSFIMVVVVSLPIGLRTV